MKALGIIQWASRSQIFKSEPLGRAGSRGAESARDARRRQPCAPGLAGLNPASLGATFAAGPSRALLAAED